MSLRSPGPVRGRTQEPGRRDRLYAEPEGRPMPFAFDESVAEVFEDMIERSVPGYRTIVETTAMLAARHVAPRTRAYDPACSAWA